MQILTCPEHNIRTVVFELVEEEQFVNDGTNENTIFRSMRVPKRSSGECSLCEWLIVKAEELYQEE